MRVTTVFKRLLRLNDVNVTEVLFGLNVIIVSVVLVRRRLWCPHCGFKTSARYDTRTFPSRWRHLDMGTWQIEIRCSLRRLRCPEHGVVVEAVPFARPGAHLTRDLDDLLAWLATRMDKTSIARLCRVSWRTVGRACARVVAAELDPNRLDGLFRIGVDEISWRKQHKYLTLCCGFSKFPSVDHRFSPGVEWGGELGVSLCQVGAGHLLVEQVVDCDGFGAGGAEAAVADSGHEGVAVVAALLAE